MELRQSRTGGSANGLASAVVAEREHISFSEVEWDGEERGVRAAAHVISNETSTCLVVEIIAAFSSLGVNLHASRPHRRYGRITCPETESPPQRSHERRSDISVRVTNDTGIKIEGYCYYLFILGPFLKLLIITLDPFIYLIERFIDIYQRTYLSSSLLILKLISLVSSSFL